MFDELYYHPFCLQGAKAKPPGYDLGFRAWDSHLPVERSSRRESEARLSLCFQLSSPLV